MPPVNFHYQDLIPHKPIIFNIKIHQNYFSPFKANSWQDISFATEIAEIAEKKVF